MLDNQPELNQQENEKLNLPDTSWTNSSDELAQSILDSIDISMALLDTDGYIRAVNKFWYQKAQFACSSEQIERTGVGINYLDICRRARETYAKEASEALAGIEAVLSGQQSSFTLEYPCASPTQLNWYVMRVTPLPNHRGAVIAHIDITDRKKVEQQKDLFISMASHELQTPLTALKGLIQLEKRRRRKLGVDAVDERLVQMETQTNRLSKFVTELLNATKMQIGRLDYSIERIDLDALVSEISETIRQAHPDYCIILHGTTRAVLMGDRDKVAQVFNNLLSNAVKYSPQARQVDLYLERSADQALITIQDYGIGIPQEQQGQLFEPFSRIDAAKHRYISGLGIGLYIVREIVNHHGGTISLQSTEGQGSAFTISFPVEQEENDIADTGTGSPLQ